MTLAEFFDELSRLSDQVLVVGQPAMTAMYHLWKRNVNGLVTTNGYRPSIAAPTGRSCCS